MQHFFILNSEGLYFFLALRSDCRFCEYDYVKLSAVWTPLLMESSTFAAFAPVFGLFLICHVIGIQVSFSSLQHMHILFISTPNHQHYLFMKANTLSNEVRPIFLHRAHDLPQCLNLKIIFSKYVPDSVLYYLQSVNYIIAPHGVFNDVHYVHFLIISCCVTTSRLCSASLALQHRGSARVLASSQTVFILWLMKLSKIQHLVELMSVAMTRFIHSEVEKFGRRWASHNKGGTSPGRSRVTYMTEMKFLHF